MKYTVIYAVHASTWVDVEFPEGELPTRAQIIEKADNEVGPSLCHQCSSELEIGDIGEVADVLDDQGEAIEGGDACEHPNMVQTQEGPLPH